MRILHVSTWRARCGIANYAEKLADHLSRQGVDNEPFPISPHEIRTMVPGDIASLIDAIGRRAQAYDLVHLQHEFSFYSSPTTTSSIHNFGRILAALKLAGRPAMVTFHTDPDYPISLPTSRKKLRELVLGQRWYWKVARHFRGRPSAAHALTHTMKGRQALVASGFGTDHVSAVPMGHEVRAVPSSPELKHAAKAKLGIAPDAVLMSIFGFIGAYKGHEVALRALRVLPSKYVLAVIGGRHPDAGEDQALNNMLRAWRKQNPKRLLITGYADRPTIDLYQAATDICLAPYMPDFNLSASAAITWSLTSGRPTIASGIPTFTEINRRADCLLTVTPDAPFELAWAVQRLAADEPMQARLVQNALRYAEANSWQVVAERTANIYRQVLTERGGASRSDRSSAAAASSRAASLPGSLETSAAAKKSAA